MILHIKFTYNLQTKNYFNCGAKYRVNVDKSAQASCYAQENKRNLLFPVIFLSSIPRTLLLRCTSDFSNFAATLFLNVAGRELPVIVSRNNCCLLKKIFLPSILILPPSLKFASIIQTLRII